MSNEKFNNVLKLVGNGLYILEDYVIKGELIFEDKVV